ncbi:tripartite tricarboxylate transporter substrate binding protein [Comamonas thiooxydans]|uniref:Bug family tripartite tricarboxylate transporter substrate binding protein n=1 Tax=Comamonas thiooxydans TaxID=363952 RepID=UPI000B34FF3B|nr:tripartite tricarboxylate transporter substrate binding protein [Comamonas thiooxydans]BDR09185.1 tripartite tricarboxylate transporter substrate binding protein [Comamonas thiooxydans]
MKRQGFFGAVLCALIAQTAPSLAQAQTYPVRPIKIVTPFPAGQGPDVLLRNLAEKLGPVLGQPVVVENKPGGSGFIAFQAARTAAPDGYTLVHMDSFHIGTQPHLFDKLPYSATRDFDPITPLVRNYFFVAVSANSKWQTMSDLIAAAKAKPKSVSYGSWGVASPAHLGGLMLEASTGIQMTHVPYKESSQLYTGLAMGETDWAIASAATAGPMLQSGKVRFLAAAGPRRIGGYDKVPTAAESGAPKDWTVGGWNGLLAPKGTPKDVIQRLNTEIAKVMQSPEIREKLTIFTYEPYTMSSSEMSKLMEQEQAYWGPLIQRSKIKLD